MKQKALWLVFLFCLGLFATSTAFALENISIDQKEYLAFLIDHSRELSLADERIWQVLLHYRKNQLDSGVESEVDNVQFFISGAGKKNSAAELEATLTAFFTDRKIGDSDFTAQCAFPARFYWLDSKLGFDFELMPKQHCEMLELWQNEFNPASVSLIFSSYYLTNPASMFGHTFMRFNNEDVSKPELLDLAINYAAEIDEADNFFEYAWKGVIGGFDGRFSITPYYDMVRQYNDFESRDLWEYELNLSPAQIDFMLLHAWELSQTNFDFFFLKENCSYHLLSLLEVADPTLNLRDQYKFWTLPAETVKQVSETPGLVREISRRPSLHNQLEKQFEELSKTEKELVEALIHDPDSFNSEGFMQTPNTRLAAVIDTAIIFSQYLGIADSEKAEQQKQLRHQLLIQRSKIDVAHAEIQLPNMDEQVSPDQSHDPFRFSISTGEISFDDDLTNTHSESYIDLSFQPGFHNLLSREQGHAPNSQIRFLALNVRYGDVQEDWRVEEFALIDIMSLYPVSSLLKEPSWKLNIEWERNQDGACADCTPFILNPGIGIALESNLHRKEIYYSFLEANLEFDHELESEHRGGFGLTAGLLIDASDQWRIGLTVNRKRFTQGARSYVSRFELQQRFYFSRNLEFVFDLSKVEQNEEGKLGFAYYF